MTSSDPTGPLPRRAVVVGTGMMAPGIAVALNGAGIAVTLTGRNREKAGEAAEQARQIAGRPQRPIEARALTASIFPNADLVVETVIEDLAIKREVLAQVENWCNPDAVLATNTSSLRLKEVAVALQRPNQLGGLHFLNPAHLTSLVEVVATAETSATVAAMLQAVAIAMGKTPLLVRSDIPGFIWNRLQAAMIRECVHLVEEVGLDPDSVDLAVTEGLAPRWLAAGPLGTIDLGGVATFRALTIKLFPELSNSDAPSGVLANPGADADFHGWDDGARRNAIELRDEALNCAARIRQLRRRLNPSPMLRRAPATKPESIRMPRDSTASDL